MDVHVARELLNELGSSLENLETQQSALLQLLKDKGIVSDNELAPYFESGGRCQQRQMAGCTFEVGTHLFCRGAERAASCEARRTSRSGGADTSSERG